MINKYRCLILYKITYNDANDKCHTLEKNKKVLRNTTPNVL
jgi:hypothetical protein